MKTGYSINRPLEAVKMRPIEFKVIVEPDELEHVSEGGLYIPDQTRDRVSYAGETGTLIRKSKNAFGDDGIWAENEKPEPGDRVMFSKYAGTIFEIREGREVKKYRLMNDKDICAILE